jgi:predicted PurR-regulated permease PerM
MLLFSVSPLMSTGGVLVTALMVCVVALVIVRNGRTKWERGPTTTPREGRIRAHAALMRLLGL